MTRAKNYAKGISFSWMTSVSPTRWAETPSEVPHWDDSCTIPVWRSRYGSYDLVEVSRPTDDYPRLVRSSPDVIPEGTPLYLDKEDVINDVAALTAADWPERRSLKNFKKAVHRLAQKYGPPFRHREHTLSAWESLAVEVRVELNAAKEFEEYGYEHTKFLIFERTYRLAFHAQAASGVMLGLKGTADYEVNPHSVIYGVPLYGILIEAHGQFRLQIVELIKLLQICANIEHTDGLAKASEKRKIRALRTHIVQDRFGDFCAGLSSASRTDIVTHIGFGSKGMFIMCPLGVYLHYKFSKMWGAGMHVVTCTVCGRLFVQNRKDMKYCKRRSCADKKYRATHRIQGSGQQSPAAILVNSPV